MKYIKTYEILKSLSQKMLGDGLIKACGKNSSVEKVKNLINQGADINYIGVDENTPLTTAVQYSNLEIVEELLKYENINLEIKGTLEPDMLSNRDSTAMVIAGRCDIKILEMLINAGADINSIGNKGMTSLIAATSYGMMENIIFLIKNGANMHITDVYGDDFSDFLIDEDIKILKRKCKKEYKQYLFEKTAKKYNL